MVIDVWAMVFRRMAKRVRLRRGLRPRVVPTRLYPGMYKLPSLLVVLRPFFHSATSIAYVLIMVYSDSH
jgi:hypothetical protein